MRAMRATPPATAPPTSAPRWLDDEGGGGAAAATVWIITFVVVMRLPLDAEVMTETRELVLRLVGEECCAAPPPAFLVVEVDVVWVVVEVDVVWVVDDGVDVVEDEEDDDVVMLSLDVVSTLPGFPMMAAEATAGPVVLIEATEVPSGNGKNSSESVLSQQTLDAFRLWSQHQLPP